MFKLVFIFFSLTACASQNMRSYCKHSADTLRCVEYVRNYDGDTITFNIPHLHSLIGQNISIRLDGIDTPEIKTQNQCEKEKAKKAKKEVARLLKNSKSIELRNIKRGKYFRIVATVIADGKSLKDELIKLKLGYPYSGKTKKFMDWCKVGAK